MLIWICFALLAAAVATMLLRAPVRPLRAGDEGNAAVYRDQLAEIEADAGRGVIDPDEAVAARAEIARRLIKDASSRPAHGPLPGGDRGPSEGLLALATLAVPVASLAVYLIVGSPSLPGRPLADRLAEPVDMAQPTDMIAKVEARLRERPNDGQGWAVLAPIYLAQGRATDAADAYARAISLVGETADRLAGLGKATVLANNGIVTEPARQAYERLRTLDPARLEADFWLAVHDEQNGRPDAAAAAYLKLLANAPPAAPWRKAVEDRLAAVTGKGAAPPAANGMSPPQLASPAAPANGPKTGPTPAEFVAAAQKLAPEMREQMIGGRMVAKARDAIKANPKDVAAWSRIVTGLTALGKSGDAEAALSEARRSVAGDAGALGELDALAKSLGLAS